jgi:comEA protein
MRRIAAAMIGACLVIGTLTSFSARQEGKAKESKQTKAIVLDINRASSADFEKLPGLGPELARRIVTYRRKHGPFRRVEDLLAVRGIGEKKWRAIRPYLTVAGMRDKPGPPK